MDLSVSNIMGILRRGLERGLYNKNFLFKRLYRGYSPYSRDEIDDSDFILYISAIEIKAYIEGLHPLSLQKDHNLHNGKEYFWLIFHDRVAAYVLSRLLNDELKEAFGLEMKSRNFLIEKLVTETKRTYPKAIIRSDIKSFFESVNHIRLLEKLEANPKISALSMVYFRLIFGEFNRHRSFISNSSSGLPRGLSISSYLAEVYLKDTDSEILDNMDISYYGRYVDDIVILISPKSLKEPKDIFQDVARTFEKSGLPLHNDSESKTSVFELSTDYENFGNYLGYDLSWYDYKRILSLGLPEWKICRKKEMIDKAFRHFERISRKDVKKARRDLMDCLNFISGNFNLKGNKCNIRTGLYYANPHLSDFSCLDQLTNYLQSKPVIPYEKSFSNSSERIAYIIRIKNRISRIDFRKNWLGRKMFSFSSAEMSRIKAILSKE